MLRAFTHNTTAVRSAVERCAAAPACSMRSFSTTRASQSYEDTIGNINIHKGTKVMAQGATGATVSAMLHHATDTLDEACSSCLSLLSLLRPRCRTKQPAKRLADARELAIFQKELH